MADLPNRLIALKLALDALGIEANPTSFQNRLSLQKAAYLAQAAGLSLGYRHNWYLKGPYSPDLTRDYFALAESPGLGEGFKLRPDLEERLHTVANATQPPQQVNLTRANWLELLASLHYLVKKLRRNEAEARSVIASTKPHLADYVGEARQALTAAGLL